MQVTTTSLKSLNWDYVWALMFMIVILGSLMATALTNDTALAQAFSDMVTYLKPLG